MASGEYNYQDDVPASPQEIEELLVTAKDYLITRGQFGWGTQNDPEAAFYGFETDEEGTPHTIPVMGWDSAPTFTDTATRAEIIKSAPLTMATLSVHGLTRVVFSYRETSKFVDPEPDEDPVTWWNLGVELYRKAGNLEILALDVTICDDEDGELSAVVLRPEEYSGDADFDDNTTDLMHREGADLKLLAGRLKSFRAEHPRRHKKH